MNIHKPLKIRDNTASGGPYSSKSSDHDGHEARMQGHVNREKALKRLKKKKRH